MRHSESIENHFASESPLRNGAKVRSRLERGYYSNRARNQISHTPMTLRRDTLRETAGNNNIEENAHTHTHNVLWMLCPRGATTTHFMLQIAQLPACPVRDASRLQEHVCYNFPPIRCERYTHRSQCTAPPCWGRCNGRDSGRRQYQTTDCCARLGGPIFLAHVQNAIGHVRPLPRPRPHSLHPTK